MRRGNSTKTEMEARYENAIGDFNDSVHSYDSYSRVSAAECRMYYAGEELIRSGGADEFYEISAKSDNFGLVQAKING